MRPLVRFIKHVLLAVVVIIAATCMLEVGLRVHRVHGVLTGISDGHRACLGQPCPLAYQQLPANTHLAQWSSDSGTTVEVSTNTLGLRGPEISIPKPPGIYRVVCLGDEATLAPEIPEEETFCRRIAAVLDRPGMTVEVINAGQPGHCPLLSLAWVRSRLIGLQPDLVILCCDISDVGDDRRCRPLAMFADNGMVLSVGHPATGAGATDWLSVVEHEFLFAKLASEQLGQQMTKRTGTLTPSNSQGEQEETGVGSGAGHPTALIEQAWEPLAGLREICQQIAVEFVVAAIPSAKTVRAIGTSDHAPVSSGGTAEMLRLLAERANREQIPLLDASGEFARHEDHRQLFLASSGALSSQGHRLFADILGHALMQRESTDGAPVAVPVSREVPADVLTSPLPLLERRPRRAPTSSDWSN